MMFLLGRKKVFTTCKHQSNSRLYDSIKANIFNKLDMAKLFHHFNHSNGGPVKGQVRLTQS